MLLGIAAAALLVVLPGAWISYGLALPGARPWLRFCTGCALSPFVLYAQYYLLRWSGASWESSLPLLLGVNLLALPLVLWRSRGLRLPGPGELALSVALLAIPLACLLVPPLLQPEELPWWLHTWMHADTIYALAQGQLFPEESRLAGIRQAYPWAAHLYQALLSRALDRPPVVTYVWFNAVALLVATFLVGGLARELGGGPRARAIAWIALWFGINLLGYALRVWLLPRGWELRHLFHKEIFGDVRYTPWLWKYRFLEHVVFGLALFAALPHFLLRLWRARERAASDQAMIALLFAAIVFVYPVLSAAAVLLIGGCVVLMLLVREWEGEHVPRARAIALGALLVVCFGVGFAHYKVLLADRHHGTGGPDSLFHMARKTVQGAIAAAPLLVATALYLARTWRRRPRAAAILALGGLTGLALYVGLTLPSPRNEYKYVFTAGVCLAPFVGVVLEPLVARTGRAAGALILGLCLATALPFAFKARDNWATGEERPALDLSGFDLRLAPGEPGAEVYDALREQTARDTVLVAEAPAIGLPALVQRSLYAPEEENIGPGMNIDIEHLMVGVRGYSARLVHERKAVRRALYGGGDAEREQALESMLALGRPLAVVLELDEPSHAALAAWLESSGRGRRLAADRFVAVWIVDA